MAKFRKLRLWAKLFVPAGSSETLAGSSGFHHRFIGSCCSWCVDHARPDNLDLRVRHYRQRQRARIVARLLAQGVVLGAVLASGWWGVHTLGAHTLASEEGPSAAWLHPVYVGGVPLAERG